MNIRLRDPITVRSASSGFIKTSLPSLSVIRVFPLYSPFFKLSLLFDHLPVPTCLVHNCKTPQRFYYFHLLLPLYCDQFPLIPINVLLIEWTNSGPFHWASAHWEVTSTYVMINLITYRCLPWYNHMDYFFVSHYFICLVAQSAPHWWGMFFTQQTSCLPYVFLITTLWYIGIYAVDTLLYSLPSSTLISSSSLYLSVTTWVTPQGCDNLPEKSN